jgi:3-oxoacyl-[acyl-carrier protein] reductase
MSGRRASWSGVLHRVLVTGASRGLGLAIAERLVADGFAVVAVARGRSDALDALISRSEGALAFEPYDLAEVDGLADLVRRIKAEHGSLYGLVNNAGIGTSGLLTNMSQADIERLIRLNTLSPILLTKYAVRQMMVAGQGRVVNIASIIAATGYNGLSVYGATKASLVGFTKSLAREVGRVGVTVNAVAPGFVETELTAGLDSGGMDKIAARSALRRLAEPQDVAASVSFLMSEGARNITGAVLTVDAGNTA